MSLSRQVVPGLTIVAAMAANRVIGRAGKLPWHLPADLKHFKQLTIGHPVVMGRRTFDSIKVPLPARRNIVVSTTAAPIEGVEVVRSLDDALALLAGCSPIMVVGGSVLYAAALPVVEAMELTELDEAVEGDTFFPEFDRSQWRVVSETRHERDERHAIGCWFRRYERA
jgi:dihydrofolate reductase